MTSLAKSVNYEYTTSNIMTNWYMRYKSLTMRSKCFFLNKTLMKKILDGNLPKRVLKQWNKIIEMFGGKVFIRMDTSSPKYKYPITNSSEISRILCSNNKTRTLLETNETDILWFREYVDMDNYIEFRCFVYNGKVTCISQNDSNEDSLQIENPTVYKNIIHEFSKNFDFSKNCSIDVCVKKQDSIRNQEVKEIMIIEVNTAFDENADTGLFDQYYDEYVLKNGNGVFRYFKDFFFNYDEC